MAKTTPSPPKVGARKQNIPPNVSPNDKVSAKINSAGIMSIFTS